MPFCGSSGAGVHGLCEKGQIGSSECGAADLGGPWNLEIISHVLFCYLQMKFLEILSRISDESLFHATCIVLIWSRCSIPARSRPRDWPEKKVHLRHTENWKLRLGLGEMLGVTGVGRCES